MATIYLVGGAVRDTLRGQVPSDRDYVVVGSSVQEVLEQGLDGVTGFRQVGEDFPVFLHPLTQEEYALARKERKMSEGYRGFVCEFGSDVSLEEDLYRRDLTVNSMAMAFDGTLIDPYGGLVDLQNKVLRHTGPHFAEDPLRVLRLARFLAKMGSGWTVHPDTRRLCANLVMQGALEQLSVERIVAEFEKALPHDGFVRMFEFLRSIDAFESPILEAFRPNWEHLAVFEELFDAQDCPSSLRWAWVFAGNEAQQEIPSVSSIAREQANFVQWVREFLTVAPLDSESHVLLLLKRMGYRKPLDTNSSVSLFRLALFAHNQDRASVLPELPTFVSQAYATLHSFEVGAYLKSKGLDKQPGAVIGMAVEMALMNCLAEVKTRLPAQGPADDAESTVVASEAL